MKTKNYYIVRDDNFKQHGTFIEEIQLTKKEYITINNQDRRKRDFAIFEDYLTALYYTQD